MTRTLATHLTVLVVGVGAGIGAVAAASPDPPAARSASDAQIIRELRTQERTLKGILKSLGGTEYLTPLDTVMDLLRDICRNTQTGIGGC